MTDWLQSYGEMAERVRRHPWEDTPLGPPAQWPDVLKTTVALSLASHFPQAIVWGPDLITLYNDAFLPILGSKPEALGRPFNEVWQEVWSDIGPIVQGAFDGQATFIENFPWSLSAAAVLSRLISPSATAPSVTSSARSWACWIRSPRPRPRCS